MKFKGPLLLMGLGAVLCGVYFSYLRPLAESRKVAADFEKRFFRAESGNINFIRVENRDGAVEITHGPEGWLIVRPQRYRPDDGIIRKLMDVISRGRLSKVVGNAAELSQFGFDRPILSLTLGIGSTREELIIGRETPAETGYYAYSDRLGKIFIIDKELPRDLYLRLFDLREKRLYPFTDDLIGRIVIRRDTDTIDLEQVAGGWQMRSPVAGAASGEEVKKFLDSLVLQKAVTFIPWQEKLRKLPQRARLQFFDRAGRPLADSDIAYWGTGEDEGIIVHGAGDPEATRTRRELWELLHSDATLLLERRLLPLLPEEIDRVSLVFHGESFVLMRQGRGWTKNGQPVTSERVRSVLDRLSTWKCAKRVAGKGLPGGIAGSVEVTGGGRKASVTITDRDMTREMGENLFTLPGEKQSHDVRFLMATVTSLESSVLISSLEVEELAEQVRQLK